MKHHSRRDHETHPFESIYRKKFEVVEQRAGHVSHYPHIDQLLLLLRALNLEFLGGLRRVTSSRLHLHAANPFRFISCLCPISRPNWPATHGNEQTRKTRNEHQLQGQQRRGFRIAQGTLERRRRA